MDGTTNQFMVAETKWDMMPTVGIGSRIYAGKDIVAFAQGATNCLMINGQWAMKLTQPQVILSRIERRQQPYRWRTVLPGRWIGSLRKPEHTTHVNAMDKRRQRD